MWTQSAANGWGEIGRSVGKTGRGKIAAGQLQKSIRLTYGTNTEIIRGVLMRVERKRLLMVSGMVAGRPAPKTTARVNRIIVIVSMEYSNGIWEFHHHRLSTQTTVTYLCLRTQNSQD